MLSRATVSGSAAAACPAIATKSAAIAAPGCRRKNTASLPVEPMSFAKLGASTPSV